MIWKTTRNPILPWEGKTFKVSVKCRPKSCNVEPLTLSCDARPELGVSRVCYPHTPVKRSPGNDRGSASARYTLFGRGCMIGSLSAVEGRSHRRCSNHAGTSSGRRTDAGAMMTAIRVCIEGAPRARFNIVPVEYVARALESAGLSTRPHRCGRDALDAGDPSGGQAAVETLQNYGCGRVPRARRPVERASAPVRCAPPLRPWVESRLAGQWALGLRHATGPAGALAGGLPGRAMRAANGPGAEGCAEPPARCPAPGRRPSSRPPAVEPRTIASRSA